MNRIDHPLLDILRANLWLRDLPPNALSEIAAIAYKRKLVEGQILVAKDEPPEGMCVVISGGIRDSTSSEDGREIVFSSVRARGLWGVVAILDQGGAVHDARACGDTEVLIIPTAPLHRLLDTQPLLYRHFSLMLCYRLRKAYSAVDDLGLASLRQRVARQLCTLGTPTDANTNPEPNIPVMLTQEELAVRVSATRPSVNRELKELQREGILKIGYGTISILDYARLHALCATKRIFDH